ncbi:hypothetical protein [Nostoc sp. FACHB-190]|uniref:hypothetical protein n=1 Tax=Nostoc sp. FACHB-190 TaxID=2692838 RepID=UPI001682DDB7|nr:hypothetical protein [Nostoc sp. FACHB-190]MBD2297164.1 hypothetical protein [Nostoc sp. FACHB-190]
MLHIQGLCTKIVYEEWVKGLNESFKLKNKSQQLLEMAKPGVKQAVETDKATATTWINQQLKALGITLTATT